MWFAHGQVRELYLYLNIPIFPGMRRTWRITCATWPKPRVRHEFTGQVDLHRLPSLHLAPTANFGFPQIHPQTRSMAYRMQTSLMLFHSLQHFINREKKHLNLNQGVWWAPIIPTMYPHSPPVETGHGPSPYQHVSMCTEFCQPGKLHWASCSEILLGLCCAIMTDWTVSVSTDTDESNLT